MKVQARVCCALGTIVVLGCSGCLVPVTRLNEAQAQNRALTSQAQAQQVEIENLKTHGKDLQSQVAAAEQQLARQESRGEIQQAGLLGSGPASPLAPLPPAVARQFERLAQRYPGLKVDPQAGVAKLDADVLFDSGRTDVRSGAAEMLDDLARVLKSPPAANMKVMVVGHTDDRAMAYRPARDQYPDNFHLSAGRALAVADRLREAGLSEDRVGVAGFAAHQPVATGTSAEDRQKNRRVEIYLLPPGAPLVGWLNPPSRTY